MVHDLRESDSTNSISLAYVVPDFANPTGAAMSLERRDELIATAALKGFAILEDGAYTDLCYNGSSTPSILALDCKKHGSIENARTIFCGTFSKTLAPGLRIGWACGPSYIIARMSRIKECTDLLVSPVNQEIVANLLDNIYQDHLEKLKMVYRKRRDAILDALDEYMPDAVTWNRPNGGMFVWLTLPDGVDTDLLLPDAIKRYQVAYVPGRCFRSDQMLGNNIRLSFCLYEPSRINEGIQRLGKFFREVL
jgi:hypothetical protein